MTKTAIKDVLMEQIVGPSPGAQIGDAEADAIIKELDVAGFVIVPKDAIRDAVGDALERAALYMETQADNPSLDGALENRDHAEAIRALKQPQEPVYSSETKDKA